MTTHAEAARSIDRHFDGTISVEQETAMRAHLPGCAACGARYRRHLLLATLDQRVPTAKGRLARGLGLRVPVAAWGWSSRAFLAVAAMAAFFLVARLHAAESPRPDTFGARGISKASGALWVYSLSTAAPPRLVEDHVAPTDELAFAYANPSGKPYLAVFGVDEHGHVYWYCPGWPSGGRPPAAFRARAGVGPHELTEAVRHALDGRRLDLFAIFSDEPLDVEALERETAAPRGLETLRDAGAIVVKRTFEVRR
jgi:hypothetical protein